MMGQIKLLVLEKVNYKKILAPKNTLFSYPVKYLPGYIQYIDASYLQYVASNILD